MPLRPCLDCGAPSSSQRCPTHTRHQKQARHHPRRDLARADHRRRRQQLIATHLELNGATCPGWGRNPHPVDPASLTADHVNNVAAGAPTDGPMQVLCRSCNGRKGQQEGRGGSDL